MEVNRLQPILNKESILKTANSKELGQAPQDVLNRYQGYALTHVPLGDTSKQLGNLQRVITKNKTCAIGTIVGPYGYGKTSTAVHLWNELRETQILAVPPFLWINLQQLMNAVYHWTRYEFEQGPAKYLEPLDALYQKYAKRGLDRVSTELDLDTARDWHEKGLLNLDMRPEDIVQFFSETTELCETAGYGGLAIFTDELQVTVADYKPSRDQFFNDLFGIVKDTLGRPGNWALIISMDDDTEGMISRLRADLLQRMQHSALYFRVKDVYNRRQYPDELWSAFEKRFGFDGSDVILPETLESIGQVAARDDLGAGPRMVTNALSLSVKHYEQSRTAYTPLHFVNDFLDGLIQFDQRGKFGTAVKKALDNAEVQASEAYQNVVKLLAAFPAGCPKKVLERFELLESFRSFPPLARRELIVQRAEGHTLRQLLEEDLPPEYIEQRLTQEFVSRYAPGPKYAEMAAKGFLEHVLLEETFSREWKAVKGTEKLGDYWLQRLTGTFDNRYPNRILMLAVAAMPQSQAPKWEKFDQEADIELHFELDYELPPSEPSQLLISPERPNVAVFQFNLKTADEDAAHTILPDMLFDFYSADQLNPLLSLALVQYMFEHSGELPDDINRIKVVVGPLRQFALTLLLGEYLLVNRDEFSSAMVGHERLKELFKAQCRLLYPTYETLITGKSWQNDLQQYNYALERVIKEDGVSVARGRRSWETTKVDAADAFTIPKRSLTRLETLLDSLSGLITKDDYSGRQADSPIKLRFKLHTLEKQWLEELETSKEMVPYNGINSPALYAVELLRQAHDQGYTYEELQEVMRLLQTREFVAFDQKQGLLIRAVDNIEDLQAAVGEQIDKLDENIRKLEDAEPEFEPGRYPIASLRDRLTEAKARDELEILKADVRRYLSAVSSYAASRASSRLATYKTELTNVRLLVQQGVPEWLSHPFSSSPLQDLLEQQRKNYAGAYKSTLDEMRQLTVNGSNVLQSLPESHIETIITLQKAYPELHRESERLHRRLKSYADLRDDLIAWRRVITRVLELEERGQSITEKYGTDEWQKKTAQLWQQTRRKIEDNPLNIPSLHRELEQELNDLQMSLDRWLENRREDYEKQREYYEKALNKVGLDDRLRIPFDQQHPADSYNALVETVQQLLMRYLSELQRRVNQTLQKIRYAEQVQGAELADAKTQVNTILEELDALRESLSRELLRDMESAEKKIFQPLNIILEQERSLTGDIQQILKRRPPEESEAELLAILQVIATNDEADLYTLIMRQLDEGQESVDLGDLMEQLQGLFQKNQIGIRIRLL